MLEAKAFLLSPAELGVVISLKHTRQRAVLTHGPFFASVCTRLCQYVIWGFGNGLKKRRKTKTQVAQNPESIEPQGFPGCIFFGNKRQSRRQLRKQLPSAFAFSIPNVDRPADQSSGFVSVYSFYDSRFKILIFTDPSKQQ